MNAFKQATEPGQQRRKPSAVGRRMNRLLALNRHGVGRNPIRPSVSGKPDPACAPRSRRSTHVALGEPLILSEMATAEGRTIRSYRSPYSHRQVEPAMAVEREWTTILDTIALLAALGAAILLLGAVPAALF